MCAGGRNNKKSRVLRGRSPVGSISVSKDIISPNNPPPALSAVKGGVTPPGLRKKITSL